MYAISNHSFFESFKSQQLVIPSICRMKFKRSIINSCCVVHSFIRKFSAFVATADFVLHWFHFNFVDSKTQLLPTHRKFAFFCDIVFASHCNIAVEIAHSMVLLILLNSEIDWATTAVLVVTPEKTHSLIVIIYICQFVNISPFAVRKTSKPSNELLQTCCMLLSFESSKKVWRAFETLQFYYYGQLLFFFCHRSLHSRQCAAFCKHLVCDDEMTMERYVWLKQVTL